MTSPPDGGPYRVGSAPSGVKPPDLPPAPEFDRRVDFHRTNLAGMALVMTLPLLAVFGLFGQRDGTVSASGEVVQLTVDYPVVDRFKVRRSLRIELTNTSSTVLPSVEVALSAPYVFAFSDVALTPGPDHIDADTYVFELSEVAPGETRRIAAEMQAQRYWRHEGSVSWSVLGPDGAVSGSGGVEFATLVWP